MNRDTRERIRLLVEQAPPLTDDTRAKLSDLLRPVSGHVNAHIPGQQERRAA